ncbi:MAG: proline--tRNA ligase [Dehalococcoidales bacterium]|nr:proline--tRNA ligase [Dehalococcoidales bacterium]
MSINKLLGSKKLTSYFWKTYREDPQNIETESHRLLHRTGFISQLSTGIFSFLPMGWRSIEKIKNIIREEMNSSGLIEINLPVIQPSDLWKTSERLDTFIPPLSKFQDRRDNQLIIAPTHEEAVTDMVAKNVNSYRDLPFTLYQIQTKYREDPRPRAGLLRVREFEMNDAYSFDVDEEGLDLSYKNMIKIYKNIFMRCSTEVIIVDADSGAIGGKESNEFVMLADSGEDVILISKDKLYAANVEKAIFKKEKFEKENTINLQYLDTPNKKTIDELKDFLSIDNKKMLKTVIYKADDEIVGCVIRSDYNFNETKIRNYLNATNLNLASDKVIISKDLVPGFISPINIENIRFLYDDSVLLGPGNFIVGGNTKDKHYKGFNLDQDSISYEILDIAEAEEGHISINESILESFRGIEVGHIFKLGDVYSKKMGANFSNKEGKNQNILMGCYGIGVGRLLAACIEANQKNNSMNLPLSISPFSIYLVALQIKDEKVKNLAEKIYKELTDLGFDLLFDDRDIQTGVKFNDSDLLSLPVRRVISKRNIQNDSIEVFERDTDSTISLTYDETITYFKTNLIP